MSSPITKKLMLSTASTTTPPPWLLQKAITVLQQSTTILILAGAGMSADSGLPTFRGKEGFWKAYPPAASKGLSFSDVSNPASFIQNERFGWGFFGHRYHLYTNATPHDGYSNLLRLCQSKRNSYFIFTSNVDGHFERTGFAPNQIFECHGSIHYVQTFHPYSDGRHIVPATSTCLPQLKINSETFEAMGELPTITVEGRPRKSRPNILMFNDSTFNPDRIDAQEDRWNSFLDKLPRSTKLVAIEIGAGKGVPTVRYTSENILNQFPNSYLIRINVDEPEGPSKQTISVPLGGKAAIDLLMAALE
jgi:NAD-dependent SIR2 family protein deacetylase